MTTNATTRLNARSPEDLLAAVPLILGFHPEESVVMLTFGGEKGSFHARVDLPGPGECDELVDVLLRPALANRTERVLFLFYSGDVDAAFAAARALVAAFTEAGLGVVDLIRVSRGRWSPMAAGPEHEGFAYDVSAHPFTVQGVYDGAVTQPTRLALAESLVGPTEGVARVEAEIPARLLRVPDVQPAAEARWVHEVVDRGVAAHPGGPGTSDADVARLLVALLDVDLRDVAWSHLTHANARAHAAFWTDVVRRAPDDFLAAPATLLAFSAWVHGHGALAWCALDIVFAIDPHYSLAELVAGALTGAIPPSSWEPTGRHPLLNPA